MTEDEALIKVFKILHKHEDRIQALEALQTQSCGGNPSDTIGEQTEATTQPTAAITVTPPTITSTTGIQ